ncbi:MAG: DUF5665 domain-containing protein [Paracoccaceae bacterium]
MTEEPKRSETTPLDRETAARLTEAVETLAGHRAVRIYDSIPRMMGMMFLRGLAVGLGTVIGATALASLLVLLLSQIEFVPVLGDLAAQIIDEIQRER